MSGPAPPLARPLVATASQTAGPFWSLIDFPGWADLLRADGPNAGQDQGGRITLLGRITDGAGEPAADAMVELWQAGPDGRYDGAFLGFGRAGTDAAGRFRFTTLKPGAVPLGPSPRGNAAQAPHVTLTIFARGLMRPLVTRLYFADEPLNATDPVLAAVPPERRATLLAREAAPGTWQLDIRLQGENETVFLEV